MMYYIICYELDFLNASFSNKLEEMLIIFHPPLCALYVSMGKQVDLRWFNIQAFIPPVTKFLVYANLILTSPAWSTVN